jgi:tetratricopeptide (TPR) repeat protein
MRLRDKTLEELEDLEEELTNQEVEQGTPNFLMRIDLYKEMYRCLDQLVRKKNDVNKSSLEYVKRKLIFHLIEYGSYLKMVDQKDDHLAIRCLKAALKYDRSNPIAAYRLGFLSYKYKNYSEALSYFEDSLDNHQIQTNHPYSLNSQQLVNAHLYLTNSALHIANKSYEKMKQLPSSESAEFPINEFSPLIKTILDNEQYLQRNAFYKVNKKGRTTCSKTECEEMSDTPPRGTIVLFFSDRTIRVVFDGHEAELSADQGNLLRHLLLKSSEDQPATRHAFSNVEIRSNTYTQNVTRLRNKLIHQGIPPIIETTRYRNEAAYYYNHAYPLYVMYRVDEEMEFA